MSKLPIKIVLPRVENLKNNLPGGSNKIFPGDINEKKNSIISDLETILSNYKEFFEKNVKVPTVARVTMREDAIAKSHLPTSFCKKMKIIGGGSLGELYVRVTEKDISDTITTLSKGQLTQEMIRNLSAMERIDIIPPSEKLKLSLDSESYDNVKVKIFNLGDELSDLVIENNFDEKLKEFNVSNIVSRKFCSNLSYFILKDLKKDDIVKLSTFPNVKEISIPSSFSSSIIESTDLKQEIDLNPARFEFGEEIIGVIDSGISDILDDFIYDRVLYVPDGYQNREHGTFVASSILFGNELNNRQENSNKKFKILDVVAIPNSNPKVGLVDSLTEDNLCTIIEEVVENYCDKVKVWNLSLGTSKQIADNTISDLAVFCDYIQQKYNVQFVIAAGNYNETLRNYPNTLSLNDRITGPGDSFVGLVVGSVAERENTITLSKINEPSPFSRIGPGANYMIKPDLVDYGGNIDSSRGFSGIGQVGLNNSGDIIENVGTSFSTPLISQKYTKILDELTDQDILLSKALLIHSAKLNNVLPKIDKANKIYYGYGMPMINSENILDCDENNITLIFKQKIPKGTHLEMMDFPFPKCLIKNGKYKGKILMTLTSKPMLDSRFGADYSRVNYDVSLGTYTIGANDYKGQVPQEKTWAEKYEKSLVENSKKWSPVKSYFRNMKSGITEKDGWKLKITRTSRSDIELNEEEFVLVVSIIGEKDDKVYDGVVAEMRTNVIGNKNLSTRSRTKIKIS